MVERAPAHPTNGLRLVNLVVLTPLFVYSAPRETLPIRQKTATRAQACSARCRVPVAGPRRCGQGWPLFPAPLRHAHGPPAHAPTRKLSARALARTSVLEYGQIHLQLPGPDLRRRCSRTPTLRQKDDCRRAISTTYAARPTRAVPGCSASTGECFPRPRPVVCTVRGAGRCPTSCRFLPRSDYSEFQPGPWRRRSVRRAVQSDHELCRSGKTAARSNAALAPC